MTSKQTDPELSLSVAHPCIYRPHSSSLQKVRLRRDSQFVDIGVEYPVYKTNTRALIRVLIRKFDVDLPEAAGEWS